MATSRAGVGVGVGVLGVFWGGIGVGVEVSCEEVKSKRGELQLYTTSSSTAAEHLAKRGKMTPRPVYVKPVDHNHGDGQPTLNVWVLGGKGGGKAKTAKGGGGGWGCTGQT